MPNVSCSTLTMGAAQFVVQPYGVPGNLLRFAVPLLTGSRLDQGFLWSEGRVDFEASVDGSPIASLAYTTGGSPGHFVPDPGDRFRATSVLRGA